MKYISRRRQQTEGRTQKAHNGAYRFLPTAFCPPFAKSGEFRGRARQAGFTLLLSALVSSVVLALGASIFILARKQVTLSSMGRDSQVAFYAADESAECALYWDQRWSYFGTTTVGLPLPTCNGANVTMLSGSQVLGTPQYPYAVTFQYAPSGNCANVTITKTSVSSIISTKIHADGFNTSCATLTTNPRTLQRSVELNY
jgi:hypothetical protein